jgi:hypothetical protein
MSTLTEYRQKLTDVETAIDNCVKTGQKYSVVGSHTNERVPLDQLRELESYYRKKILRLSGYSTKRTRPDFSA